MASLSKRGFQYIAILILLAFAFSTDKAFAKPHSTKHSKYGANLRDSGYASQPTSTQYILSTSILALSEQFFFNVQKTFIPHVFNYISETQRNLNFPTSPFFLYKLTDEQEKVSWDKSIYLNLTINNFNITDWRYENVSAETGIMLVESIQNFKSYFSQIRFSSEFNVNVDFTRLYCADVVCEQSNATFFANLNMSRMNMSISQRFQVYDNTNGTFNTSIQSISLSLGQNDLNLVFPAHLPDFSMTLNRTFASIKDYFLSNTNQLAQDQKKSVEAVLQIVLDYFSVIKIPYLNNTLTLRPLESSANQGTNPIINSNYISTLMRAILTTPSESYEDFEYVYLPIKEAGSGSQNDINYNQLQFIASQTLLVKIISSIWESPEFLTNNNPNTTLNFISFDNNTGEPLQCNMAILSRQFPAVKDLYTDGETCSMTLWISNVTDFTINTGRFYTISKFGNDKVYLDKTLTLGMNISIWSATGDKKLLFTIPFSIPLDNLYVCFSIMNCMLTYQIYNFQPANFTLLEQSPQTAGFDYTKMMDYWNKAFKMSFLKWLNNQQRQSFQIPSQAYAWISENVTNSVQNFKFDLYDKFAIINIQPNYASDSLIKLVANYIKANMPLAPDGQPYTFTSFIEQIYEYISEQLSKGDFNKSKDNVKGSNPFSSFASTAFNKRQQIIRK